MVSIPSIAMAVALSAVLSAAPVAAQTAGQGGGKDAPPAPDLGGFGAGGAFVAGGNAQSAAHLGALVAAMALAMSQAEAQKGTGEAAGVTGPVTRAELVGTVTGTRTDRCAMTTGRAMIGSHVLFDSAGHGRVNLHLGPASAVDELVEALQPGTELTARAFRTENLPPGAYVAQTVTVGGTTYTLRDADLRPAWRVRGDGGGRGRERPTPMPRGAGCPW